MEDRDQKIADLESRISFLEQKMQYHQHRGNDTQQINAEDIFQLFGIPDDGSPFGIQRATVGDGFRVWIFPKDALYLAPGNGQIIVRGDLLAYDETWDIGGTTSTPWRVLYIRTIQFTSRNVTSLSAGQIAYHDNAGTQQFRANAGGFFGSIDLTGV